jgi:riboflavin synthase
MFTGIIEQLGSIEAIETNNTNITLTVQSSLAAELKVDQSLSHSGVCLTIEEIIGNKYKVTAIDETLKKTTIGLWKNGDIINLERCLRFDGRLDGHIVQGHVDTVGTCIDYKEKNGSWEYVIEIDEKFVSLIIEKGSISLNGISLTIFNISNTTFTVAIIPYTYEHTNIHTLLLGDKVNVEFDMVGKYVGRMRQVELENKY